MELHLPPKPTPTVLPGEFRFAAAGLAHGHIYGMVNGLLDAGAELVGVWDEDLKKVSAFQSAFPQAHAASCLDELLDAPDISLIVSAAVPSERCPLGLRVMAAGKDYFVDKAPMTTPDQLAAARRAVVETGRKYMVYYSERLHNEAATLADELIRRGEIGRVLHMEGFGPHRLGNARIGSTKRPVVEAFFVISEATNWNSSYILPERKMLISPLPTKPTTPIPATRSSKISANVQLPPPTAPPATSG